MRIGHRAALFILLLCLFAGDVYLPGVHAGKPSDPRHLEDPQQLLQLIEQNVEKPQLVQQLMEQYTDLVQLLVLEYSMEMLELIEKNPQLGEIVTEEQLREGVRRGVIIQKPPGSPVEPVDPARVGGTIIR